MQSMRKIMAIAAWLAMPLLMLAQWRPDTIGDGFEMRYVDQGADYSGPVRCAVVRKVSACGGDRGVLYVHGYNDYFFQKEMGDIFVDSCFNFYAVDLRKYGRSILPGQTKFEARDLGEYFADIDSALQIMKDAGIREIVLMGHSTGGLVTALYMKERPDPYVRALVLNSPFLDWNMTAGMRKVVVPMVGCIGEHSPKMKFSNGHSTAYGESLLKSHHGEWEYNTDWKTLYPEKVSAGWIKAIDRAHDRVRHGHPIFVPVLLMHSDNTVRGDEWNESFQHGDAVLDVKQIQAEGRLLGPDVTELTVKGGLHDLILSAPSVRAAVYAAIFSWLRRHGL